MAKKIKFPLKMADDAQVRSMEELREHFDLASVLGYYTSGRLAEWLADRYYEEEAEKIAALDSSSPEFKRRLCETLGVPYAQAGTEVDLEAIAVRNERCARLKQFTADDAILAAVDLVAFSQEELADLLDEDEKLIYLCGERFKIPCSRRNVTYIGVNNPLVDVDPSYDEKGIVFKGVRGTSPADGSVKSIYTSNPDYFGDMPNDVVLKAAKGGNLQAQIELARRYDVLEHSPSGLSNPEQAEYWYRKVHAKWLKDADKGDANAQFDLAESYSWGNNGVEMDDDEANRWYRAAFRSMQKSAEAGDAGAQDSLGVMYFNGYGTEEDVHQAMHWWKRAAKQGDLDAMKSLADNYGDDEGGFYDVDQAEYWMKEYETAKFKRCKREAEEGDTMQQSILGDYYANGQGTQADAEKAEFWYKLAFTGFQKAAEQGDARAQIEVARCYYFGEGVREDKRTAFQWYRKAAEQGNNRAMKIVGDCYKDGDGVEENEDAYLRWYKKAAQQGNQQAEFTLTSISLKESMNELTNTFAELKDSFSNGEIDSLREQAREINERWSL